MTVSENEYRCNKNRQLNIDDTGYDSIGFVFYIVKGKAISYDEPSKDRFMYIRTLEGYYKKQIDINDINTWFKMSMLDDIAMLNRSRLNKEKLNVGQRQIVKIIEYNNILEDLLQTKPDIIDCINDRRYITLYNSSDKSKIGKQVAEKLKLEDQLLKIIESSDNSSKLLLKSMRLDYNDVYENYVNNPPHLKLRVPLELETHYSKNTIIVFNINIMPNQN